MTQLILAIDEVKPHQIASLFEKIGLDILRSNVQELKVHDAIDGKGFKDFIKRVTGLGINIWADYKLHDIPTTVKNRTISLRESQIQAVSVHATGGVKMMKSAVESGIAVYAVTALTSQNEEDVMDIYNCTREELVIGSAQKAIASGVHRIVCSANEIRSLKSWVNIPLIVPGTRSKGASVHDQLNVMTPKEASKLGADYLVIGREVTESVDPRGALMNIVEQIQ